MIYWASEAPRRDVLQTLPETEGSRGRRESETEFPDPPGISG